MKTAPVAILGGVAFLAYLLTRIESLGYEWAGRMILDGVLVSVPFLTLYILASRAAKK
jgi:hypothetical protein